MECFFHIYCRFIIFMGSGKAQIPKELTIQQNRKTFRLLVIGNSFSRNATLYLPQLAKEGGYNLEIQKAEISGGSLKMHWDAVEITESNSASPKGKPYNGKSLKTFLLDGKWDFITLQQASTQSAYLQSYYPYISDLYHFIKKFQPKAEILIHQT